MMEHTDTHGAPAASPAPTAPAGWYDDPGGSGQLRYWTGAAWSGSLRPASPSEHADTDETAHDHVGQTAVADASNAEVDDDDVTINAPIGSLVPDRAAPARPTTADQLVEVLETSAGLSLTQLARETGRSRAETLTAIDDLKRTGIIVEVDEKPTRYYRTERSYDTAAPPAPRHDDEVSDAPASTLADRLVEVLESSAGLSLTQLARETGRSRAETLTAIDDLKRTGMVVETDDSPTRYYRADGAALSPAAAAAAAAAAARQASPAVGPTGYASARGYAGSPPPLAPAPPVTFGAAVSKGIDRALDFTGRATRPEYWWFALFTLLVGIAALIVAAIPGIGPILAVLVWLAVGLAQLAVGVRRLHDTGRSGAWIFWLSIAPLGLQALALPALGAESYGLSVALYFGGMLIGGIGGIVILVFLASPGDPRSNRYGPPPG